MEKQNIVLWRNKRQLEYEDYIWRSMGEQGKERNMGRDYYIQMTFWKHICKLITIKAS